MPRLNANEVNSVKKKRGQKNEPKHLEEDAQSNFSVLLYAGEANDNVVEQNSFDYLDDVKWEGDMNYIPRDGAESQEGVDESKKEVVEQKQESLTLEEALLKAQQNLPPKTKKTNRTSLSVNQLIQIAKALDLRNNSAHQISLSKLAKQFNISGITLYRVFAQWERDPTLRSLIYRVQNCQTRGKAKKTLQLSHFVLDQIRKNPFLTVRELTDNLNNNSEVIFKFKGPVSEQKAHRSIKISGFVYKRILTVSESRNDSKYVKQRHVFSKKIYNYIKNDYTLYFIDEMLFNVYIKKTFAWIPKNEQMYSCINDVKSAHNVSVLGLIASDGMTGWEINLGKMTKEKLYKSLKKMMISLFDNSEDQKRVVICGKANDHNDLVCNELFDECKLQILEMPLFSQQINPVYHWLKDVKTKLKSEQFSKPDELKNCLLQIMNNYAPQDIFGNNEEIQCYLLKGIQKQPF